MATDSPLTLRTEFFQQLKTHCVPLSRLILAPKDVPTDFKLVLHHLSSLTTLWTIQSTHNPTILDSNIASYVFFPLSHLLQDRERYPVRVVEEVLRLVRVLVKDGWKGGIEGGLWRQLVLLMGLLIGGSGGVTGKREREREMSEEGMVEGFRTLGVLLGVVGPGQLEGMQTQTQTEQAGGENNKTKLALAQAVAVILDGITESDVVQVQVEAAECLWTMFSTIKDRSVLAQFFPGTVSALAKLLSPPQANRTQKRLLTRGLEILQLVLTAVLGDLGVRSLLKQLETIKESEKTSPADRDVTSEVSSLGGEPLTASWLRATAAQVKIALAAVLKLRAHDSDDVQSALHKLCITLLDECHASLADCRIILVETAMMLEDPDANNTTNNQPQLQTSLQDLITIYPSLTNPVQSALYTWVTGLPRVMQASDERVKQLAVRSILRGTKLAAALQMDSSTLDDALGASLRDSIVTLVRGGKPVRIVDDGVDVSSSMSGGALVVGNWSGEGGKSVYAPVLLDAEGQKTTREEIGSLIANTGSAAQQVTIAMAMLGHVRDSEGVEQIASFWLAFQLIKATYSQSADMDEMFDLSSLEESRHQEDAFRELYDFSASVLAAHSDSVAADWRLEAVALEVAAFAAARMKVDFQPELIDVLYPVTTFLGSGIPQLRKHAIMTLDIVAASCGYASVSDLIVENADYMVNSISLRLNTFDISPASTKVLTMVIRLTGPRLIPYLDDVVAAIFAALDNYHGYPVFVESLFAVLSEVVTQGVKSDELLLEGTRSKKGIDHRKQAPTSQGIPGILQTLIARLDRAARSAQERDQQAATLASHPHPQKPWGPPKDQAASLLDKLTNPEADPDQENQEDQNQEVQDQEVEPPKPPTHHLLTKILSLTQNHLTTPSPTLRKSLLHLITTVSPALSRDEDAFLPLVHAVWPVAITRLWDREPYVAVAACEALGGLCEGAGDFLGGRWRGVWWDGEKSGSKSQSQSVRGWMRGVREGVRRGNKGKMGEKSGYGNGIRAGTGRGLVGDEIHTTHSSTTHSSDPNTYIRPFTQPSQLWTAALHLLTSIATYVRLEDDMFDDILDLVADVLPQQPALRRALEAVNADAVWLVLYERGMGEIIRERPVWEEEGGDREGEGGLEFVSLKEVVVV
ncbi:armadillo-type protein [Dichotomopilus funicola]|uniref:Armadillo-type protein n=1 Tax=Dichotomopilus funicola TaxID=1934379 RepID=A0AAN6V902_9PEZI|nr:armadillo-type protein [Dichotomopilus funicola]